MAARIRKSGGEDFARMAEAYESALVRRGPLTGIFVVDEGSRARLRWITAGEIRDGRAEVLTGLKAGERFVLSPPPGLEDGAQIEVK